MFKRIDCCLVFLLFIANSINSQKPQPFDREALLKDHPELQKLSSSQRLQKPRELSTEAKQSLEEQGFRVLGTAPKLVSPRRDSLANENDIVRAAVSFDLSKSGIKPTYMVAPPVKSRSSSTGIDTIITDNFEGDFPGTKWQLSGNPTWGKTNYTKHLGSYSLWCAKDGTSGIEPGANYPNNCHSMIIYGPFDLSDVNYAQLKFWFWLDTEYEKDWFFFMASKDGNNFQGIGVTGETSGWEEEMLHLSDVPGLGNVTGGSQVWISFLFESDANPTSDKGAFVDDVNLYKRQINGTPIVGTVSGELTTSGNPYVAVGDFGIAEGDTLEIKPGVEIHAEDGVEFAVLGLLKAIGTPSDTILFTSAKSTPSPGDWGGIGLYDVADSSCRMEFCRIEFAGAYYGAIVVDAKIDEISNCLIQKNKTAGIYCCSEVTLKRNKIIDNREGIYGMMSSTVIIEENELAMNEIGVYPFFSIFFIKKNIIRDNEREGILSNTSEPIIVDNIIKNNGSSGIFGGGAYDYIGSGITAIGNTIVDNQGYGIALDDLAYYGNFTQNRIKGNTQGGIFIDPSLFDPAIKLWNNSILNNGNVGVDFSNKAISKSVILNNIIAGHEKSGLRFMQPPPFPSLHICYNDLYDNKLNIETNGVESLGQVSRINSNDDSCDVYFNIFADPLLVDIANNNFALQQLSPCRNAGAASVFYNDEDGTMNDIGVTGGTELYLYPMQIDFENLIVSSIRNVSFEIANFNETQFTVTNFELSDKTNFDVSFSVPLQIPAYGKKSVTTSFKPQHSGNFIATLTISSPNYCGANSAEIILKGQGISGTVITSDQISGIWDLSGSPYIITKSVEVPENQELIIQPGVRVLFENGLLTVKGLLSAIGTSSDSIVFSPSYTGASWNGLVFSGADSLSKLEYCRIEYSDVQGIQCNMGSNITVSHCTIENNQGNHDPFKLSGGGGIDCDDSSPIIINNIIRRNRTNKFGGGIVNYLGSPIIRNNIIEDNWSIDVGGASSVRGAGGGIYFSGSKLSIVNNIIVNNHASSEAGGLYVNCLGGEILNNVISYNSASYGGGLQIWGGEDDSDIYLKNSIISHNTAEREPSMAVWWYGKFYVSYSDVQGGWQGDDNIDTDPLFIDPTHSNFHLQSNSPCIDKGNPDSLYNDPEDPNKPGYALYPALGTVRNDMGAFGGPYAVSHDTTYIVPSVPVLLSPPDKDTILENRVNLTWHASDHATSYNIELSHLPDFSSVVFSNNLTDTTYEVTNLETGTTYYWRVNATNIEGTSDWSEIRSFTTIVIASIEQISTEIPAEFYLGNNYPNPFYLSTSIGYSVPSDGKVTLVVFDILCREIATLVNEKQVPGKYEVKFDGSQLPVGIYFYRLQDGEYSETRKMVLIK